MLDLTVGSIFAGIGGIDLGAERAGFDVAWQCEIDDFCRDILNYHWPHTPTYRDVRSLYRAPYRDSRWPEPVDVLCGGFPCQDISLAGKGGGLSGDRSGLWWEFARIIRRVRPRYVVVENVPALVHRGLDAILGWLATHGYDAEWQIISAAAMGAPHIRERLFVVAYPSCERPQEKRGLRRTQQKERTSRRSKEDAKPLSHTHGCGQRSNERKVSAGEYDSAWSGDPVADTTGERCDTRAGLRPVFSGRQRGRRLHHRCLQRGGGKWHSEPDVGRMADGVPARVDRLQGLGNAVVPQVAEFVFQCIMQRETHARAFVPGAARD